MTGRPLPSPLPVERAEPLRELDLPLILLIGGATGTGKSTVAIEVAHRLGTPRVTSTDFVRETMRAFVSEEVMPSIHPSSFEAGDALGTDVVAGFLEQTRHVLVGVQALIERALQEGWSLVVEGVHLVPGMLPPVEGAFVVQCLLAISRPDAHEAHFWIRDSTSEGLRPVGKYVEALPRIRCLQDWLVERARLEGIPVVENTDIETSIERVMELVLAPVRSLERV